MGDRLRVDRLAIDIFICAEFFVKVESSLEKKWVRSAARGLKMPSLDKLQELYSLLLKSCGAR